MPRTGHTIKFFTHREMARTLCIAKDRSARDYAMILLAYRHGLRCAEICGMRLDQVDLESMRIRCDRGKGSVTNWQEMAQDEADAVTEWLPKRPCPDSPYMFVSCRGGHLNESRFRRIMKAIGVEAGVPPDRAHPHALKHSIAVHLVEADVPVQLIQRHLGHRNIQNTMVYLQIADTHVDRAVRNARAGGFVV